MASAGDKDEKTSAFWTTLPGILTGIAAIVTAITGVTLGLLQYGVFGSKQARREDPAPCHRRDHGPLRRPASFS
jgi:hypothetical protein